jgi:SRSO17 transposase
MDVGYGNDTDLRTAITALGMSYVAGILTTTTAWPPGTAPLLPQTRSGRGRPQTGSSATASTSRSAPRRWP